MLSAKFISHYCSCPYRDALLPSAPFLLLPHQPPSCSQLLLFSQAAAYADLIFKTKTGPNASEKTLKRFRRHRMSLIKALSGNTKKNAKCGIFKKTKKSTSGCKKTTKKQNPQLLVFFSFITFTNIHQSFQLPSSWQVTLQFCETKVTCSATDK